MRKMTAESSKLNLRSTRKLNNGIKIPVFGFGTYRLTGKHAVKATKWAIDIGYRLIDTASFYENEKEIGQAVKECGISRESLFITTKLWNSDHGKRKTIKAFKKSLKELKLDYIDLYLIHWPKPGKRVETWEALEQLLAEKKVRSIGVSNFTIEHLEELKYNTEIIPAVNQVEFSPFLFQKDLLEYCVKNGIILEAYAPLTRTNKFDNPIVKKVATKYQKTEAQILLRWCVQHQAIPIPKSGNMDRIKENSEIFDFSIAENEMYELNALDEGYRITVWDPTSDNWK